MTFLEPEIGSSTPTPTTPLQATRPSQVTRIAPLGVNLPDALQTKIAADMAGTLVPSTVDQSALDTSAIIMNRPNAMSAWTAKTARWGSTMQQLPEPVRRSLFDLDRQRVEKGQSPLNDDETIAAILTTTTHKPATIKEDHKGFIDALKNLPSNAVTNAGSILKAIPHMLIPTMSNPLIKELAAIPNFQAEYQKRLGETKGNVLAALAQSPGVRLVPGSFVAGQAAQGSKGIEELLRNPVSTALDVLPVAGKLAEGTNVGRIAAAEKLEGVAQTTPLRALLTRKALPAGEVSLTGSALEPARLGVPAEALKATKPGQWMTETFGHDARQISKTLNTADAELNDILKGSRKLTDPEDVLVRKAYKAASDEFVQKYNLTPKSRARITNIAQMDRNLLRDPTKFTAAEQAAAGHYARLTDDFRNMITGSDDLMAISPDVHPLLGGEVYAKTTGRKILKAQEKITKLATKVDEGLFQQLTKIKEEVDARIEHTDTLSPGTVDALRPVAPKAMVDRLRASERGLARDESILNKLDTKALDRIGPLHELMSDYFNNPNTTVTLQDLEKASRGLTNVKTRLGGSGAVGKGLAPEADIRIDTLSRLQSELKRAADAEKKLNKLALKAPDRWHPVIQGLAEGKATQYMMSEGVPFDRAAEVLLKRQWDAFPEIMNDTIYRQFLKDAEPLWVDMKAKGIDPLYVHHVGLNKVANLKFPRMDDVVRDVSDLSQAKARTLGDSAPYVHDISLALGHQALEFAGRKLTERAMGDIGATWGRTKGDLLNRVDAIAERRAALDPRIESTAWAEKEIAKTYVPFKPREFFAGTSHVPGAGLDEIWIPKAMNNVMEQYFRQEPSKLLKAIKPVTGLFRTAVLPFAPRWHVNNIIGGAIVETIENGPLVYRRIPEAIAEMRKVRAGEVSRLPDELVYSMGVSKKELGLSGHDIEAGFRDGSKVAEAFKKVQEHKIGRGFNKFVQGSYDFNGWVDDLYRSMDYLHKEGKALKKGAGEEAARDVALQSVNRVFQNWNAMTPIERNLLRQVFPFYAFTSYAVQFLGSYPGAHPVRAAIMSNLAQAELADMDQSLPRDMLDFLQLSGQDEEGNARYLSLRGLNPFSDTANLGTVEGFLSGMNPVLQAVAKAAGADTGFGSPVTGQPTYDKETGKLTTSRPGFLESLISSTVPQLGTLQRGLGMDDEYNSLLRTNPEAARRLLLGGIGVPSPVQTLNIPQVETKAELARMRDQSTTLKAALESGDYDAAVAQFPALAPVIERIKSLRDQQQLAEYHPTAGARSTVPWPT